MSALSKSQTALKRPTARCLTQAEAASYLGIGVTLLATLDVPFLRIGRRRVYDRVDLDRWLDDYKGRAGKETLWPVQQGSIGGNSRYWWIRTTLPDGRRLRQSAGTESREEAEALLAQIRLGAFREKNFGIKPQRSCRGPW